MKRIRIEASTAYDAVIGSGVLSSAGALIKETGLCGKAMIVSDDVVFPLYGGALADSLEAAGFKVYSYIFPNGEKSKHIGTVTEILGSLAENEFTRSDLVVALGGGVVGDVAGFSAGIYLRGIKYVQAPTTLLAAVDSSVGGKTGVDLPQGKNLAGVFHQPALVICDADIISRLPEKIFACGLAEVIKCGAIRDEELFKTVESGDYDSEEIICRSVAIKKSVVEADEFDNGERQLLNFGHTFGHAVEKLSDFKISHGEGVAIGMVAAARFAGNREVEKRLIKALERNNLPTENPFGKEEMFGVMALDKKRRGDYINLILPVEIGRAEIKKFTTREVLERL